MRPARLSLAGLFVLLIGFVIALLSFTPAYAATGINDQISFQGKLVNTNGTNVADNDYSMTFRLYTVASAGSATWTETQTVTVADGVFQVYLGAVTDLPGSADFYTDNLYLGVEVASDGEMDPRIRFASVPQAFVAESVAGLTVTNTTGTLTIPNGATISFASSFTTSGANTLTLTTGGTTNVTLPTTGTLATLAGSEELTNKSIGSTGLTFSGATTDVTTGTNEDLTLTANGTGDVVVSSDGDTQFRVVASAAPAVDMVDITNSGQGTITDGVDGLSINFTAASDAAADTNAAAHITITDSGDSGDVISGLQITAGTAAAGSQYGINIEGITGGGGTEYGLVIGSGWDRGLSVASASQLDSTVTVGTSGNTFTFDPSSGPAYAGTARPAKTLILQPEYSGGTLTAFYGAGTDTNITGSMTADVETSSANSLRTYYQWLRTTDATQHFYTVAVRVTLPSDFSAWATSNALQVAYVTQSATNTVSDLDVRVYLESNSTTAVATSADNASTSWTTVTIDDSTLDDGSAPEWDAAGETAVMYLRMGSASSNYVRVGSITLNYLAAY